jgi:hypothetical protein
MKDKSDDTPWGCIGAVLAAIIMSFTTLLVAVPDFAAFVGFENSRSIPERSRNVEPTYTPDTIFWPTLEVPPVLSPQATQEIGSFQSVPSVLVINRLFLPTAIYIDNEYEGRVEANSQTRFYLRAMPVRLRFETIRQTDNMGRPWGDIVAGTFTQVMDNSTVEITNVVDDHFYFYPILNNNTSRRCDIVIDDAVQGRQRNIGVLEPGAQRIVAGYYRWYYDSNVTLHCNQQYSYWGIREGHGTTINPSVQVKTGRLELIIRE